MSSKKPLEINSPKVNGFSSPLHALQVISWIAYAYLNISFHFVYGLHQDSLFILLNALHLALSIIIFTSTYLTTNANVVDKFVKERGFPTATMQLDEFQQKYQEILKNNELFWCKYCKWYVSKSSKHCRACNRCTTHFDHHCRWLNNCVSRQNYNSFAVVICCTETMLLYDIILGILMLSKHINIHNHLLVDVSNSIWIYTFIALHVFVACFMAIPLAQLILFHIYLHRKQISTYDWVVGRETQKIQKIEKKIKIKNKEKERDTKSTENKSAESANCPENDLEEISLSQENTVYSSDSEMQKGCNKYIYSLVKQRKDSINKSPRKLEVDTNVRLSGLTNGDESSVITTQHTPDAYTDSWWNNVFNVTKKRNSVHAINIFVKNHRLRMYSQHDCNADHNDVIFAPDRIQSIHQNLNENNK